MAAKKGLTVASRRIAEAVDNEDWQKYRLSLKGLSTRGKLDKLRSYQEQAPAECPGDLTCDYCIRVDNYIKALCRGGQLWPGESLRSMIASNWNPAIKS